MQANTQQNTPVLQADDSAAVAASAWLPPTVNGPRATRRQRPTLSELDDIERIAWDEGFLKGQTAGLTAAEQDIKRCRDELEQRIKQFEGLLTALAEPLQQLDEEVETQLVALAGSIAKHLVRRELRLDPTQVIAVVRETVGLLPLTQRNVRVRLHPLDAALMREKLAEPNSEGGSERAWTLVEDPVMSRGGCRVSTDTSQIDARLEARLAIVMNHLLGDGRLDVRDDAMPDDTSDSAADQEPTS